MGRKSTRKQPAAAERLLSPLTPVSDAQAERSPVLSPEKFPDLRFDFNFNGLASVASSSKKNNRDGGGSLSKESKQMKSTGMSPMAPLPRSLKSMSTISDLKDLASSNLESIKRKLEVSHSEILKDIEASQSRLHKRFKMQTQACQQMTDEAENEYKRVSEGIKDGQEAMKTSYSKFIAETQANASRLCKTTIPELRQTFEKGIASLRSQYGISSSAV